MLENIEKEMKIDLKDQKKPGSLNVLIISSSAVACLPFISGFKNTKGKWRLIKLFAKHIKIGQQRDQLKKNFAIGIGTPNRIKQLVCKIILLIE